MALHKKLSNQNALEIELLLFAFPAQHDFLDIANSAYQLSIQSTTEAAVIPGALGLGATASSIVDSTTARFVLLS
ncbi:hypothetical protein DPMN_167293 [Dreissena polymorpha]|uniref:Uncharacterized protein n=1 Tax=Dreissena polymorpha TaxID=45954 RepID=A0A9D4IYN3_DREPO|nr:hypothetical protein DPMN_167293 [Dreissena polymorpha]